MSTPASLLASARSLIEADPDAYGLVDRCEFITIGTTSDGMSGHKETESSTAADQPCLCEELSGPATQIVAGGVTKTVTHRIFTLITDEAIAVTEHYKIRIAATDDYPVRVFETPHRNKETMLPIIEFRAVLTSGYRSPGNT